MCALALVENAPAWSALIFFMNAPYSLLSMLPMFFLGLALNGIIWKPVADVNTRLEESGKFSYLGWHLGKLDKVWKAHKRLCPHSSWRIFFVVSFVLTLACFYLLAR